MKIMNLTLILAASVGVATAADPVKNDWPGFRGPTGDGISLAKGIPTTWSTNQNVLWSVDLPKPFFLSGPYLLKYDSNTKKNTRVVAQDLDLPHAFNPWSSPIISGDKVFVATSGVKPENHSLLCFNLADGKRLWETPIPPGPITLTAMKQLIDNISWVKVKGGPRPEDTHISVGYSLATPCTDGELVFVTFMSYVLTAVDFQGKIVWRKTLAKETDQSPSGGHSQNETDTTLPLCFSTSPIIYNNLVIQVTPTSLRAFERKNGEMKYEIPYSLGEKKLGTYGGRGRESWSTPILVNFRDKTLMIYHGKGGFEGHDPENGNKMFGVGGNNYGASPVYDNGFVFGRGLGGDMFAFPLDVNAVGNIFVNGFNTRKGEFYIKTPGCAYGSSVVSNHTIYQYVNGGDNQSGLPSKRQPDKGVLVGLKVTGKTLAVVNQTPLPGGAFFVSIAATADGYIYLATGGRSYVLKTDPQPELVGTNELDDFNIGASPALTDGKLIIRGNSKLWCIGKQ